MSVVYPDWEQPHWRPPSVPALHFWSPSHHAAELELAQY